MSSFLSKKPDTIYLHPQAARGPDQAEAEDDDHRTLSKDEKEDANTYPNPRRVALIGGDHAVKEKQNE